MFGIPVGLVTSIIHVHDINMRCHLARLIVYNPSMTFWAIYKVISVLWPKKFEEKFRMVKKGRENEFEEFFNLAQFEKNYGGTSVDLKKGEYWPPKNFDENPLTVEEIKERNLMSFCMIGDKEDAVVLKESTPMRDGETYDQKSHQQCKGPLDR